MLPLFVLIVVAYCFMGFIGFLNWALDGIFPRWFFILFGGPIWRPYRPKADAGFLVWEAFKINPSSFTTRHLEIKGNIADKHIKIELNGDGRAKVHFAGKLVPISAWGDYLLYKIYRIIERNKKKAESSSRTTNNRQNYVDGTRALANALALEIRQNATQLTDERVAAFDAEAKYLAAKKVENVFSGWVK